MFGHGTTITFANGFFAQILSIAWSGITRTAVDATDFATTDAKAFEPADLPDSGEVTVEVKHRLDAIPPMKSAPEEFTINWPVVPAKAMTAQGFMTAYAITVEDEEFVQATATIKITGDITWPT